MFVRRNWGKNIILRLTESIIIFSVEMEKELVKKRVTWFEISEEAKFQDSG